MDEQNLYAFLLQLLSLFSYIICTQWLSQTTCLLTLVTVYTLKILLCSYSLNCNGFSLYHSNAQ